VRVVSTGAGYFVLAPSADRSVLRALRRVERDSPPIGPFRDAFQRRAEDETISVE
jgi:hypothetical protein